MSCRANVAPGARNDHCVQSLPAGTNPLALQQFWHRKLKIQNAVDAFKVCQRVQTRRPCNNYGTENQKSKTPWMQHKNNKDENTNKHIITFLKMRSSQDTMQMGGPRRHQTSDKCSPHAAENTATTTAFKVCQRVQTRWPCNNSGTDN